MERLRSQTHQLQEAICRGGVDGHGRQMAHVRAAEAVGLFCYLARRWIGVFAVALGGPDTLVLSGGIGENAPEVRTRICDAFDFLGIELDGKQPCCCRVIRTDEEWMIANTVCRILSFTRERGI